MSSKTSGKPFYFGIIRGAIGAFGALFSNIRIERREGDSVKGKKKQSIKVPIVYSNKEKWYNALTSDPDRENEVATTFPRMAFEILGMTYDSSRKTTRSMTISCNTEDGQIAVNNPAPWNLEVGLYLVSNKTEDVLQILEQILPTFNPDYTLELKTVDELNLTQKVPISLTSIGIQDDYQGDYTTHRVIIYTLSFTIKLNFYGQLLTTPLITEVNQNFNDDFIDSWDGDVKTGQITHTRTYLNTSSANQDEN
jgi:hypothetical protein